MKSKNNNRETDSKSVDSGSDVPKYPKGAYNGEGSICKPQTSQVKESRPDICTCGHDKEHHLQNSKHGNTWCLVGTSTDACPCEKYTPSPQTKSHTRDGEQRVVSSVLSENIADTVQTDKSADTFSARIERDIRNSVDEAFASLSPEHQEILAMPDSPEFLGSFAREIGKRATKKALEAVQKEIIKIGNEWECAEELGLISGDFEYKQFKETAIYLEIMKKIIAWLKELK